jgi:hypothetical protein
MKATEMLISEATITLISFTILIRTSFIDAGL